MKEQNKMSRLSLVKQSEMILPSVLSEASSLVAKRERVKETRDTKRTRMDTKRLLKVRHKRKRKTRKVK